MMLFLSKPAELEKFHTVSIDAFGNAVPDVPSIRAEGSSIAATIVETREILILNKKTKTDTSQSKQVSLMKKLLPLVTWSNKDRSSSTTPNLPIRKEAAASTEIQYLPRQEIQANNHRLSEFVQLSFEKLQNEFDSREEQLEKQFQSLKQQNQLEQTKNNKWFLPIMLASAIAGGYMLYILTNMQYSMNIMSASIPAMNQHMGNMAKDTQAMNQSMQHLNGNVAQMNNQVYQMNQQMGGISQSIKPMGDAAATTQPFLGMMRSFMPF